MPFSVSWHTLLEEAEDLPGDATLITPLSHERFRITDTQEHRVLIEFVEGDGTRPLQREQFETLYERIQDAYGGFELDRIPPDAEPYASVLSVHPRFEIDEEAGEIRESEEPTETLVVDPDEEGPLDPDERTEPDVGVYADALLLIDALERLELEPLEDEETEALVDLYTLLSDVQRSANDLRQDVADVLLGRVHHDRPVSGQYGSVQRTSRRNRSLKDDEEILSLIEAETQIDPEQVMGVDRDKLDEALDVTELSETDVYEVTESEYVRKAEVDEDVKETRLQGLKDRLAATESEEAEELQAEIEELEERISELTEFRSGQSYHNESVGG